MSGASPQSTSLPEQSTTRALWCLIFGDSTPFKVSYHTSTDIDDLKTLIHREKDKKSVLQNVNAVDLALFKLREPIPIEPYQTFADRVRSLGEEFSSFSTDLGPTDRVSVLQPLENHLHVIVQVPPIATISPSSSETSYANSVPMHSGPSQTISHCVNELDILSPDVRPLSPPVDATAINASIAAFLEKLRPKIKAFLTGSRLAVWEPSGTVDQTTRELYRKLAIPTIKSNRPNFFCTTSSLPLILT